MKEAPKFDPRIGQRSDYDDVVRERIANQGITCSIQQSLAQRIKDGSIMSVLPKQDVGEDKTLVFELR